MDGYDSDSSNVSNDGVPTVEDTTPTYCLRCSLKGRGEVTTDLELSQICGTCITDYNDGTYPDWKIMDQYQSTGTTGIYGCNDKPDLICECCKRKDGTGLFIVKLCPKCLDHECETHKRHRLVKEMYNKEKYQALLKKNCLACLLNDDMRPVHTRSHLCGGCLRSLANNPDQAQKLTDYQIALKRSFSCQELCAKCRKPGHDYYVGLCSKHA